jgi:hypothetical protein
MIKLLRKLQIILKSDNTGKLTTKLYYDSMTTNTAMATLPTSADIRHYGRGVRNLVSQVNKTVESFKFEFNITGCEEKPKLIGWGVLMQPLHDWRNQYAIQLEDAGIIGEPGTGIIGEPGTGIIGEPGIVP